MLGRRAFSRGAGSILGLTAAFGLCLAGCERSKTSQGAASAAPSAATPGSRACVAQLTGYGTYTCALLNSGQAWCWGLGIPLSKNYLELAPVPLQGFPSRLARLFPEHVLVCATAIDGSLWCGGGSSQGQLTKLRTLAPTQLPQQQPFRDVTHLTHLGRCLLSKDELRCWEDGHDPVPITDLPANPTQLVGDSEYACVLLESGQVFCRGSNLRGQLGILEGATEEERLKSRIYKYSRFTQVKALGSDTRLIATGGQHSCALKRDGAVWCWGGNDAGQIGKGDISTCVTQGSQHWLLSNCTPEEGLTPSRVDGLPSDIRDLALGLRTTCAIDARGSVWCWGYLDEPTLKPVRLDVGAPVTAMTLGEHWCALLRDGRLLCQTGQQTITWNQARTMSLGCP